MIQQPRPAGQARSGVVPAPISEADVISIVRRLLAAEVVPAFPVGAIYTNVTGVNPGTELGYGTWTAFAAGRVLAGFSGVAPFDVAEASIGASTHTHTYTDVVKHTHPITLASHAHDLEVTRSDPPAGGEVSLQGSSSAADITLVTLAATGAATSDNPVGSVTTGTTAATANLPAATVVYFWKRTA